MLMLTYLRRSRHHLSLSLDARARVPVAGLVPRDLQRGHQRSLVPLKHERESTRNGEGSLSTTTLTTSSPSRPVVATHFRILSLSLSFSPQGGVFIGDLKEEIVLSPQQVMSIIAAGEAHRHVGSTDFNEMSSRSHTIFRMVHRTSLAFHTLHCSHGFD